MENHACEVLSGRCFPWYFQFSGYRVPHERPNAIVSKYCLKNGIRQILLDVYLCGVLGPVKYFMAGED